VLAFQTLYSYEVGGIPLEDLLSFSWASESGVPAEDANKEEYAFARLFAAGTGFPDFKSAFALSFDCGKREVKIFSACSFLPLKYKL